MKKTLITAIAAVLSLSASAQFQQAPAFPGAEGFGRYTTGGRGGQIIHVTSLEDYCDSKDYSPTQTTDKAIPGTLRYAIRQQGPRIIVFDVAGTIHLKAPLKINNGDVTILGQTAPGDGICVADQTFNINCSNAIVRFIRCRMGDQGKRYFNKGEALTGAYQVVEDDAMNSYHKAGNECHNVIIDHCSMSWSTDECASFYGNKNFTLQWCIIGQSLRNSTHVKGRHGYGGIWGGENASFHHNVIHNNDSRNPRFDHGYVSPLAGPVDYINNTVFNWGIKSAYGGETAPDMEVKKINMIANYYKAGEFTRDSTKNSNLLFNPTAKCSNCNHADPEDVKVAQTYIKDNMINGRLVQPTAITIKPDKNYSYVQFMQKNYSKDRAGAVGEKYDFDKYNVVSTHAPQDAYDKALQYAGASYKRDALDQKVAEEIKSGQTAFWGHKYHTPGLIDSQTDAGGWPALSGTAAVDTDKDGIPDAWEDAHGLNKNDAADASAKTLDKKGYYTNIEVYANYLVQDITKAERAGAKETFEEYYPLK